MLVRAIGLATTGATAGVSPTIFMLKPTGISLVALIAFTANLAASTQAAITDILVKKSLTALKETGLKRLVVAGGVGANQSLRSQLNAQCALRGVRVHYPELHLCTDNGAMIAMAAAMRLQSGLQNANTDYAFNVKPRWPLQAL